MREILPILLLATAFATLTLFYRPALAAPLFGLAAPIGLAPLPGGLQMVIALSMVLIAVAMVERLQRGLLPFPLDLATVSATVWAAGIVVSVMLSENFGHAVIFGTWQIVVAFLAIAWAELAGRRHAVRQVLACWLIGAIAVSLTGLLMSSGGLEAAYGGAVVTGRPVGVFGQPNEYGLYCMLVCVFTIGIATLVRGALRWLAIIAMATSGVGLVLSLSRGAWIGAAAGVLVLAMLIPQTRRPLLVGCLIAATLGAVMAVFFPDNATVAVLTDRLLSISDRGANPYDFRPSFLAEGLREWEQAPIFGQGPNMYPELSTGVTSLARPGGAEHPHNFWIAVGAEQGFVGIVALLGFGGAVALAARAGRRAVVATFRRNRRRSYFEEPELAPIGAVLAICSAAALVAFLVEGFADFPMRNALSRTTVWMMVGWALAGQRLLSTRSGNRPESTVAGEVRVEAPALPH